MAITSDVQNIRVRLEPAQYEALRKIAERNERHITQEIRLAVRKHIEAQGKDFLEGFSMPDQQLQEAPDEASAPEESPPLS